MHSLKKLSMGLAALAALALGGSAIAGAANNGGDAQKAGDGPDEALTGTPARNAGKAATKAVGGGRVVSVEKTDEGGPAVYEVKVDEAAKITEVQVTKDYAVSSQKADDDASDKQDRGDGDGEKADDAQGADKQDRGDGDGEKADDAQGADKQDRGDGDGEKADDAQGADKQDKGDGDGEKADDAGATQDNGDGDGEKAGD